MSFLKPRAMDRFSPRKVQPSSGWGNLEPCLVVVLLMGRAEPAVWRSTGIFLSLLCSTEPPGGQTGRVPKVPKMGRASSPPTPEPFGVGFKGEAKRKTRMSGVAQRKHSFCLQSQQMDGSSLLVIPFEPTPRVTLKQDTPLVPHGKHSKTRSSPPLPNKPPLCGTESKQYNLQSQ